MLVVRSVVLQWSQFCIPCGFADRWWRLRLRSPSCLFWFRRNHVVHGTPLLSLKEMVGWSELYLADFQGAAAVLGVRLGLVVERWRVPSPGWVKINSNVAVDIRGRRLGFGVVFRDSAGKVLVGYNYNINNCRDLLRLTTKCATWIQLQYQQLPRPAEINH
ncbi:hypothetical protein ACOSQ4_032198 [Xanthoceras sorbifolium]